MSVSTKRDIQTTTEGANTARTRLAFVHPRKSRTLLDSFGHAVNGLRYVLRTQRNARVHVGAGVCVLVVGVVLGLSWLEFATIAVAVALVFFAELANTVAEAITDLVTCEYHPLAKAAKDVAAGAVLWAATMSVVIGILVIGPHLLRFFE